MNFRRFLLCAVSCTIGGAGHSHSAPRPFHDTELRTGVELCEATFRTRLKAFDSANLYFDTPNPHCWIWDDVLPGFTLWASRTTVGGLDLPVVVGIRKGDPADGGRRRIVVRVIGGPGGSIAPNTSYATLLEVLRPGDILVTPAYPGTRHGTFYPAENLTPGAAHIARWLREVRRRNPGADVVLVGESLGAPVALEANRAAGAGAADAIVQISPLAYSSADAQRNFTQRRGAEYRNDAKVTVRVLRGADGTEHARTWQQIFSTDLFKTFFPESERSTDIGPRLRANGQFPILLVYGTLDWRAGVAVIERLNPDRNLRIVRIEGMPHEVGAPYRPAVVSTIIDFLDQPRQTQPQQFAPFPPQSSANAPLSH